jgi:hypothetical protein
MLIHVAPLCGGGGGGAGGGDRGRRVALVSGVRLIVVYTNMAVKIIGGCTVSTISEETALRHMI